MEKSPLLFFRDKPIQLPIGIDTDHNITIKINILKKEADCIFIVKITELVIATNKHTPILQL